MTTPDQIVTVTIDATPKSLDRPGFGVPLIAVYHALWPERTRSYTDLAGMITDGFTVASPAGLAASAIFSQPNKVPLIKVGRRALPPTQTITIKCLDATEGVVYNLLVGPKGSETAIAYTVGASATPTTVATAIELLVEAVTDVASSSATDTITAVVTAGTLLSFIDATPARAPRVMQINDTTADPGIATDLAAIALVDNAWYGLLLDSNSKAEIVAAAAWVEAADKLLGYSTADANVAAGVSGNVGLTLKTSSYRKSFGLFTRNGGTMSYGAARWMGSRFSQDPGSANWAWAQLAGLPADVLSSTETSNVSTANITTYENILGVPVCVGGENKGGKVASGEWIDIVWGVDWNKSNIQVSLIALFINNKKLPFTDPGIGVVQSTILGELRSGVAVGLYTNQPKPSVNVPKAADVSATDKGNRVLKNVTFVAYLAGAINAIVVHGTVTY